MFFHPSLPPSTHKHGAGLLTSVPSMRMMPSEWRATRERNSSSSWSVSLLAWGSSRHSSLRASRHWAELLNSEKEGEDVMKKQASEEDYIHRVTIAFKLGFGINKQWHQFPDWAALTPSPVLQWAALCGGTRGGFPLLYWHSNSMPCAIAWACGYTPTPQQSPDSERRWSQLVWPAAGKPLQFHSRHGEECLIGVRQ